MAVSDPIPTRILGDLVSRMQRTHDRRRASFFVGPPGIGKSTAIRAFKAANPRNVMVTRVVKRGATGPQVLQSMLLALGERVGRETRYITNATSEVQRYIAVELDNAAGGLSRDDEPDKFPKLTIVFDEAQRLTNGAIDALRDWNEPHYFARVASRSAWYLWATTNCRWRPGASEPALSTKAWKTGSCTGSG